jgi:formylglycine-generating enzyme required for sulfatase activity
MMLAALLLVAFGQADERIAELIQQLNADEPEARWAAQEHLMAIGTPALAAVERAARSDNPEVRHRALALVGPLRLQLCRQKEAYAECPLPAEDAQAVQTRCAKHLGVQPTREIDLGKGVKLSLALIPPGEFTMGSPEDEEGRAAWEDPPRRVRIKQPFWIGRFELRQRVWESVMEENPSSFKEADNPVESVSREHLQEFLEKLGKRTGKAFRLPTEIEWEYACRAGTSTRYCFGDDEGLLGDYVWYARNSGKKPHRVGTKKPNAWSLHDMHGNLMEWCKNRCGWWPGREEDNDDFEEGGVIRGGAWSLPPHRARSTERQFERRSACGDFIGFRVLLPARLPEK